MSFQRLRNVVSTASTFHRSQALSKSRKTHFGLASAKRPHPGDRRRRGLLDLLGLYVGGAVTCQPLDPPPSIAPRERRRRNRSWVVTGGAAVALAIAAVVSPGVSLSRSRIAFSAALAVVAFLWRLPPGERAGRAKGTSGAPFVVKAASIAALTLSISSESSTYFPAKDRRSLMRAFPRFVAGLATVSTPSRQVHS